MVIYLLTTIGTMMVLPGDEIDPVTGVIGNLDVSGFPGLMEVAAIVLAVIVFVAMTTYQVAYSRLIFVSGLERHLPRIFTHLNPRTRNPVTAMLIQGVMSSLILVGLYSQSSMANVTIYLQGGSERGMADLGFLLLRSAGDRAEEVCGSLCQRDVLAYSRRHVGGLIDRRRRHRRHLCGIYYSFASPWIDVPASQRWMTWVGSIAVGMFVLGVIVYFFGRRSATRSARKTRWRIWRCLT